MSKKLSKRKRYILKWNGPHWNKRWRRAERATLGKGTEGQRMQAVAYLCRHRGFMPSESEFLRMAGITVKEACK